MCQLTFRLIGTIRRERKESEVSSSGEEYVLAEVKFGILSTPLVLMVNHVTTRTFRETKKKNKSFFPLHLNVYVNLDNRERARARNK